MACVPVQSNPAPAQSPRRTDVSTPVRVKGHARVHNTGMRWLPLEPEAECIEDKVVRFPQTEAKAQFAGAPSPPTPTLVDLARFRDDEAVLVAGTSRLDEDVQTHLLQLTCPPSITHIHKRQPRMDVETRTTLMGWIAESVVFLRLPTNVFFDCVCIVSVYLQRITNVPRGDLGCLGLVAIWVCCKFNERSPPSTRALAGAGGVTCSSRQMIELETRLLDGIAWTLRFQSPISWFQELNTPGALLQSEAAVCRVALAFDAIHGVHSDKHPRQTAAATILLAKQLIDPSYAPPSALSQTTKDMANTLADAMRAHALTQNSQSIMQCVKLCDRNARDDNLIRSLLQRRRVNTREHTQRE